MSSDLLTRPDELYYVSPTKVTTALACPLKAHRRYVQKLRTKQGLGAYRGDRLHEALETTKGDGAGLEDLVATGWREKAPPPWRGLFHDWLALRAQMAEPLAELDALAAQIKADAVAGRRKGGAQAPRMTKDYNRRATELLGPWQDTLESLDAEEAALLTDPERSPWEPPMGDFDPHRHSGFALYQTSLETARGYTSWWQATAEDARPDVLQVEAGFKLPLEEFLLAGRIDRVDLDPVLEAVVVVDYKSGRGWDKQERWVQAAFYAIGAEQISGARPEYVRFVNLDQGPSIETYPVRPGWDLEVVRVCRHVRGLLEGQPVPSFHGCGFCSFQALCFDPASGATPFTPLEAAEAEASKEAIPA